MNYCPCCKNSVNSELIETNHPLIAYPKMCKICYEGSLICANEILKRITESKENNKENKN